MALADPDITEDTVLGGRLHLRQPRRGHRVGHDAILLAASTGGGAASICGRKNGNSGSGAAAAGAENAVAPIASAAKAAMRVLSLNELNIGRPLFYAHSRRFRRVVG